MGSLGIDVTDANGFDIGAISGSYYALFTVGSSSAVYMLDPLTGSSLNKVGDFPVSVNAMAVGLGF